MFKATLTAILLSSVAIVPAATITVVASVDTAHAKSDNAGGNGGGKGNSGGSKGGKSASAKSNSKAAKATSGGGSKGKSTARSTGNDPVGKFLRKLSGQDKKTTTRAKAKTARSNAPKVAKAAPAREKGPMHPSNLGKMNGAMNANVNALIAHVKNGNTNGPIGGMAALAVAGYAAEGAAETLAVNEQFEKLDQLLIDNGYVDEDGNPDLEAYRDDLEGTPPNGNIDAIEKALTNVDSDLTIDEALREENNGVQNFASVEEYQTWRDGTKGADPIAEADVLIADLEDTERPIDAAIDYANEQIENQTAAEDYMLSIWNKGDGDDTVRSEAEEGLITALYERIEADGETLTGAIEEYADLPEPPADEPEEDISDTGSCDLETGCEEDVVAAAE